MTKTLTVQQILALPMGDNDANATTIADYFVRLAEQAWIEEEGFSGKRPFGNSGWQHEVYTAFAENDLITHTYYGDDLDDYDSPAADKIISDIFKYLRTIDWVKTIKYREPEDWHVVLLGIDPYGEATISDCFSGGFTEKEAKTKLEQRKQIDPISNWIAIKIPE